MKPFDLEKAKAGAKVVNQDGQDTRIICFDRSGNYPITALIKDCPGTVIEEIYSLDIHGKHNDGTSLHMAPVIKQAWVNVYYHMRTIVGDVWPSEREAEQHIENRITHVKTMLINEWEEQ